MLSAIGSSGTHSFKFKDYFYSLKVLKFLKFIFTYLVSYSRAPESGSVTPGHSHHWQVVLSSHIEPDPVLLTLTQAFQDRILSNTPISFGYKCTQCMDDKAAACQLIPN